MNNLSIGDVAIINPPLERHKVPLDQKVSFVPMAGVSEITNKVEYEESGTFSKYNKGYTNFQKGDILLAKITPCFENGKVALADIEEQNGFGSTEFIVLRVKKEVILPEYLFFILSSERFRKLGGENMSGSAGQKRLRKDFVENYQIRVPSLKEQEEIVRLLLLNKDLIFQRMNSIKLLDDFVKSSFIEMFGDPVGNPKKLNIIKFGSIIEDITYGSSHKSFSSPQKDSVPILRIPNIIGGSINYNNLQFQTLSVNEKKKLILKEGDILFVRTNGNPNYIGRCAVFKGDEEYIFASYLIRARLKVDSGFDPIFVRYCFSMDSYKSKIRKESRTTAGNYNINTQGIRNFDLIKPPLKRQQDFVKLFSYVESIKQDMYAQSDQLEAQLQSLMQKSFSYNYE